MNTTTIHAETNKAADREVGDVLADDHPSSVRVERFLQSIEDDRTAVIRRRWVGAAVGVGIGAVAVLTAFGLLPVAAEEVVLSASAVAAGLALSKS